MGTGKTTVGRRVAERLGRRFIDMDQIIMTRTGRSVPEIFSVQGEEHFRDLEAELCKEFSEPRGLVISTGGGALVNEDNYRMIASKGNVVICLTAELNNLVQRIMNSPDRPLAQDPDRIRQLYRSRQNAYRRIHVQLDTTNLEPDTIATALIHLFDREVERESMSTPVQSPTGDYDILVARDLLYKLRYLLADYRLDGRIAVVTNDTIAPLYGEKLVERLPNATLITVPDGEQYKTLDTVSQLYSAFLREGMDRKSVVVALGGGVVGDMAGFAAATFMRGVKLVQVPTSLLAMVDSSVGGKVGVDLPEGKNLVGAFKQPEIVLIDPNVLHTLPQEEINCGLAEAIKHGLIVDPVLLDHISEIASGDPDWLRRTIQVKVDIVQRDPYERNERQFLNLGHTFAHAIEQVSGYEWLHGNAVGLGLLAAAKLSEALCSFSADDTARIRSILEVHDLPTSLGGLDPDALWSAMHTDKKWKDGRSHFVVLKGIGKPKIVRDVPKETVIEVLEGLQR